MGQSAKGPLERAKSWKPSGAWKSKSADSDHRLLEGQQLWPKPGPSWLPPPHLISFKIHLLIVKCLCPSTSVSPSLGGVGTGAARTKSPGSSPLLPLLQLSHPIHHSGLSSVSANIHGTCELLPTGPHCHRLGPSRHPLCPGQLPPASEPSPWGHSGLPPACSLCASQLRSDRGSAR